MSPTSEDLLNAVLGLREEERIEVVEALLASLGPEAPPLDDALRERIERRSTELDSGLVAGVPWEDVKRRAREAIGG